MITLESPASAPQTLHFEELLEKVHRLGKEVIRPCAAEVDRDARFPREALQALREAKLLSAYVPRRYGGMELDVRQIVKICEALGQYCSAVAMIYAMHKIQVACVVHHAQSSPYFQDYLSELVTNQRLMASATTETGVGGDLRSSRCAVEVVDDSFTLTKSAPVISYGEMADDILVTCRRAVDAPPSDQVHVLIRRGEFTATPLSTWDTMGFRGTCSLGFVVAAKGRPEQILPEPFANILAETMHPYSHLVWCALWTGIAIDAVNQARAFVRAEARKTPGETPVSALRLSEIHQVLQEMRHNVASMADEYYRLLTFGQPDSFREFGFAIRTNNLKLSCSQRLVDVVGRALLICGIAGYRNDSPYSLSRQLRDAYGAALMVNNDRILKLNSTMLMVQK